MSPRKKQPVPEFPELTCAACRFCVGSRDDWECWSQPPKLPDPEDITIERGRPTSPSHPACYFFVARSQ